MLTSLAVSLHKRAVPLSRKALPKIYRKPPTKVSATDAIPVQIAMWMRQVLRNVFLSTSIPTVRDSMTREIRSYCRGLR